MNTKPSKTPDTETPDDVKAAPASKTKTDQLPSRLGREGEIIKFRVNEDGSITKEWYTDRQRMHPTSLGHKVEIKKVGADHVARLIDYGWWGMQEMKDSYGRVIDRVETNFIGITFEHKFPDIPSALTYILDWIEAEDKKNAHRAG